MNAVLNYQYLYGLDDSTQANYQKLRLSSQKKDMDIGEEFMNILNEGTINTVFQPIVSLKDGSILGYEALSRGPKGSPLESPVNLFDLAKVYGKVWELEFLCRIKALENASKNHLDLNIFINVDPSIINDDKFKKGFTKEFLKNFNINPEKVIFEITERNAINDFRSFKQAIDNYKEQGYKIAIDDTGAGYSGLTLIAEIHPHYIKLDMNLIRNIDKDGLKYALIKTFYDFCMVADIKLIAEGIETENELNTLIEIGIQYGQGYLIQKPSAEIQLIHDELISHIKAQNKKKESLYHNKPSTVIVGDIVRKSLTLEVNHLGSKVLEIFNSNPTVYGLPVLDGDKLAGLIMRDRFYAKLGTQYGFALFLNRPVTLVMDKNPLCVESTTTIDIVSKQAMTRSDESLYDYIVVHKEGKYAGIVTVRDLLVKSTELEVNYAKHLNPLSGLPGNILIEQKLKDIIDVNTPYTVLYVDIDNFKVYNDVYGFENGDKIIQCVARILTEVLEKECSDISFIGHIGGDDFILIIQKFDVQSICEQILNSFEKSKWNYFTSEDLQNGYILAKNRHGIEEKFGLITLSIAGVSNNVTTYKDIYHLAEHASKIKKKCKEVWNNCFIIE